MKCDILITNAHVITMDPDNPRAEALVIGGNKILAVGKNADILDLVGSSAIHIDAQGNSLLPGFIDSHMHLLIGCAELDNLNLESIQSMAELRQALVSYETIHPEKLWICGSHMKYVTKEDGSLIDKHDLDNIIKDRPVVLMAYDYHTVWVNSKALEQVGGEAGDGTGLLREPSQYGKVLAKTGIWGQALSSLTGVKTEEPFQPLALQKLIRKGMKITSQYGITSIHNMDGNIQMQKAFLEAEQRDELDARILISKSIMPDSGIEEIQEAAEMKNLLSSAMVSGGSVKIFMDGVIESETACLLEPYATNAQNKGEILYSSQQFRKIVAACQELGLQVVVHAIGDGAIRHTLDCFEKEPDRNGAYPFRHRIEHLELIHPDDIRRLKRLGVIASMQPYHVPVYGAGDSIWLEKVGKDRVKNGFLWQSIRQGGGKLIFSSDWPVASPDPLKAVQSCLTRLPLSEDSTSQRQSIHDVLRSYTADAAYAEHQENIKGKIKAGYLADVVLLSQDLLADPENAIKDTVVKMTIFNGNIVYESI